MGRLVCGWLCPFGLIQDLLHKIPFVKKVRDFKGDRQLRYLKYIILIVFVIISLKTITSAKGISNIVSKLLFKMLLETAKFTFETSDLYSSSFSISSYFKKFSKSFIINALVLAITNPMSKNLSASLIAVRFFNSFMLLHMFTANIRTGHV